MAILHGSSSFMLCGPRPEHCSRVFQHRRDMLIHVRDVIDAESRPWKDVGGKCRQVWLISCG